MITIDCYLCDRFGKHFVEMSPSMTYPMVDPRHIDGAIEMRINGVAIFDKSMWDLEDQLWAYVINKLESLQIQDRVAHQHVPHDDRRHLSTESNSTHLSGDS